MPATVLETVDLVKRFGGIQAVNGCSFTVSEGEVVGLIGPNGAGKSTVVEMIAGGIRPDSGQVRLCGTDITGRGRRRIARQGLLRTFQHARLVTRVVSLENVMIAESPQRGETFLTCLFPQGWREAERRTRDRAGRQLASLGLAGKDLELAGQLSGGEKKLLDLIRAGFGGAKVLVLDEPVSGVNPRLVPIIAEVVKAVTREGGAALLVEHNLRFVEQVCDRVLVMTDGKVLTSGSLEAIRKDRRVIDAYLGRRANSASG
jgi:ABC-type branched-subunit amino acid transport system ATPase component